jgi:hypothetical protein
MLSQGIPINPKKPGSSQARGMDPMQRHVLAARKNKKTKIVGLFMAYYGYINGNFRMIDI